MRFPSNPVVHGLEGRPFQMAEQPLWYKDYNRDPVPYSICGRCQTCFPAFDLEFTWGANKPTKVTPPTILENPEDVPREDWHYIFGSIRLTRQPIRQVGDDPTHIGHQLSAGPPLAYTCCHWSNPRTQFGSVRQVIAPDAPAGTPATPALNQIFNLQWFLFYGNSMNCINGIVPLTISDIEEAQIISEPLDEDSFVEVSGTLDSSGGNLTGWCLALLKREIFLTLPLPTVRYRAFALYHLPPPENQDTEQGPSLAVFNCRSSSVWDIAFNPLNLPPHTIRTVPAGP